MEELRVLLKTLLGRNSVSNGMPLEDGTLSEQRVHPRWVRVNTLKTTVKEQVETTFGSYKIVGTLGEVLRSDHTIVLHVDEHIPNLLALPASTDLSKTPAYLGGAIILQDKASCFPAHLLDPMQSDGNCLDACAAPGNKTTHLAAILHSRRGGNSSPMILACERDKPRASSLLDMVRKAGAEAQVNVHSGQDFLKIKPAQDPWNAVGSLLLDPSCSGSGIVGRDDILKVTLPSRDTTDSSTRSKKRKRDAPKKSHPSEMVTPISEGEPKDESPVDQLTTRLEALSAFQLKLLLHAFSFPKACKITYSTCSIYPEENERVVIRALQSEIARERAWRILRRHEQVEGLQNWHIRGYEDACGGMANTTNIFDASDIAQACIRCEKGTKEGTQGFFVAAFIRDSVQHFEQEHEDEWGGFSDAG